MSTQGFEGRNFTINGDGIKLLVLEYTFLFFLRLYSACHHKNQRHSNFKKKKKKKEKKSHSQIADALPLILSEEKCKWIPSY